MTFPPRDCRHAQDRRGILGALEVDKTLSGCLCHRKLRPCYLCYRQNGLFVLLSVLVVSIALPSRLWHERMVFALLVAVGAWVPL